VKDAVANRCGKLPGLERTPAVKALADPANFESEIPAIKAAAEIKAAEDLKPQKIKAVRYLAKIGCGCYNKDGKITKALLATMEDCTEDVRRATIEAIGDAASEEYCEYCKQRSCCNEEITQQLARIAHDQDEFGCYVEPSEQVRRAALEALAICCPSWGPFEEMEPDSGIEEALEPEAEDIEPPPAPVEETANTGNTEHRAVRSVLVRPREAGASGYVDDVDLEVIDRSLPEGEQNDDELQDEAVSGCADDADLTLATSASEEGVSGCGDDIDIKVIDRSPPNGEQNDDEPKDEVVSGYVDDADLMLLTSASEEGVSGYVDDVNIKVIDHALSILARGDSDTTPDRGGELAHRPEASEGGVLSSSAQLSGTVIDVDRGQQLVHIQLDEDATLSIGRRLEVFHRYLFGTNHVADLEVVTTEQGLVNARPLRVNVLKKVKIGDRVHTWEDG